MTTRRHLRLVFYDNAGQMIPTAPLLSAVSPAFIVGGTTYRAFQLSSVSHELRRQAALSILMAELRSRKPVFRGVALIACPDRRVAAYRTRWSGSRRRDVTPATSYLASFAVCGQRNEIIVGDMAARSPSEAFGVLGERVRAVVAGQAPVKDVPVRAAH